MFADHGGNFDKTPVVIVTPKASATSTYRGSTSISTHSVSNKGFTIRMYNASAADVTSSFDWIAIDI